MSNVAQDASASGWTHAPLPASSGHARRAGRVALAGMLLAGLLLGGVLLERAAGPGASAPSAAGGAAAVSRAVPAFFERNVGQADKHVRFFARTGHATLGLTSTSAIVASAAGTLTMRLHAANPHPVMHASGALPGKVNYLLGRDRADWHTNVPISEAVTYRGVYPGVDMTWYGAKTDLEYDFTVAPGANPGRIALDLHGATRLRLTTTGELAITMRDGTVTRHKAPVLYQRIDGHRVPVTGSYVLAGHTLRFDVGAYDRSRALTIDPLLYSTLLGDPSGGDVANAVAVDSDGAAYIAGTSDGGTTFPVTPGAFQTQNNNCVPPTCGSPGDGFVAKLDPTKSGAASLVYATYLGGTDFETPAAIAVDAGGHAYVSGDTGSPDFPVTAGTAYQPTKRSADVGSDGFLTELNAGGTGLLYSTFIGGTDNESNIGGWGLALDGAGRAYVCGGTSSTDFPTVSPLQSTNAGGLFDGFVAKLDTSVAGAGALLYSTYLGGSGFESGCGLAVDASGNMFVALTTSSTDMPGTAGSPIQPASAGDTDGYVTEIAASGQQQLWATYLGGTDTDRVRGPALDGVGNIYVSGYSISTNFPTTPGAFQTTNRGGVDAIAAKIAAGGTSVLWATYLGGTADELASGGPALGGGDSVWLTGLTRSADFPLASPIRGSLHGFGDAFVAKLSSSGAALPFSTYLGGPGESDQATPPRAARRARSMSPASGTAAILGPSSRRPRTPTVGPTPTAPARPSCR